MSEEITLSESELRMRIEELALLLLYLAQWVEDEKLIPGGIHRAWKTVPFDALDALTDKGYLVRVKRPSASKSVVLTDEGLARARELEKKYLSKF